MNGVRIHLLAALIAGVALVGGLATETHAAGAGSTKTVTCGTKRWTVKTLQDKPHLNSTQDTTIAALAKQPRPSSFPDERMQFEYEVFRVRAQVTKITPQDDEDLHVFLRDGAKRMIAEAPSSSCTIRATAFRRRQMRDARDAVRVCADAAVTGVAFFDVDHGQSGHARNFIELHPILVFRCLSG